MFVGKLPSKGASIGALFDSKSWFDDQVMECQRYQLIEDAADDLGDVTNTTITAAFRDRVFELLNENIREIDSEIEEEMRFNSDILGCFAVRPHNDHGICDFNQRWLLVLQCGSGYTFIGEGPEGEFAIPLKPGMIIAFDESKDHEVIIDKPGSAKNRKANYMYTMPNPDYVEDRIFELDSELTPS